MGIVVIGDVFIDVKGYSTAPFIPGGRNAGVIQQIHGGVGRNVVEDIANIELKPTFVSLVDDDAMGDDVIRKLERHKVDTRYMRKVKNGMGTWLAVFDNNGDLAGSISQRPDLMPLLDVLAKKGDEIFANADSIIIEVDVDKEIVKKVVELCEKHQKKLYGVVSNMSIAVERRDFLQKFDCFICNQLEAGMFFADDFSETAPKELAEILAKKLQLAKIPSMVVTMGGAGSVYADMKGKKGFCPAKKVQVKDTTGAGDAFCAGVSSGLKTLAESVEIGTRLAASVITSSENVCPRFLPGELGIEA